MQRSVSLEEDDMQRCEFCGKEFEASKSQVRRAAEGCNAFCCPEHMHAHRRQHLPKECVCCICGKTFTPSPYVARRASRGQCVTCSPVCARAENQTRRNRKYAAKEERYKPTKETARMLNLGCPWAEGRVQGYDRQVAVW